MKLIFSLIAVATLSACASVSLEPAADRIELVRTLPNSACQFLGELSGAQGNRFTAGLTTDESMMMGARNELRNRAQELGANVVLIDDQNHSSRFLGGGTHSSVYVGKAYLCPGQNFKSFKR